MGQIISGRNLKILNATKKEDNHHGQEIVNVPWTKNVQPETICIKHLLHKPKISKQTPKCQTSTALFHQKGIKVPRASMIWSMKSAGK